MAGFIDEDRIFKTLEENKNPDKARVAEVIAKAREMRGLNFEETAILLQAEDKELVESIFNAAREVKLGIYGKRLVLFAPLYVSNLCPNSCLYCAFRVENKELKRKALTIDELKEEVQILEDMGHKRVLLVYGEAAGIQYIVDTIGAAYSVKSGKGEMRRVNVNLAPLSVEDFKTLQATGIGTYQCFQETYHLDTYHKMHPAGKKADYEWRLYALDRAQEGGINDVAMGALFGLYDWKFEILAMYQHAEHLDKKYGVGPHTISFPRIEPAQNSDIADKPPYEVSDDEFRRAVAITRLMVPYTGMIMSTRETAEMRRELFDLGVSQISAGSRTHPGGYKDAREHAPELEQFTVGDTRPLDEVIYDVAQMGYVPSFCTGCYRLGRTGQDFMELAKPGLIKEFCLPNALLTFMEYLEDYASPETRIAGLKTIEEQTKDIPSDARIKETIERLKRVQSGERDLYF
ncbi:MAG: [FeFe] hydrogenase H-cluster radical SAM maturase HydG [bacterium]